MIRLLFVTLLASICLHAQFRPSSTCKFLTPEEAAAVIGAGAKLKSAIENGACTYNRGPMTLTVAQPARISDRKVLGMAFENSAQDGKAKPLTGVGDRAHIKKENSGYQIMFLKGDGMGAVAVYGDGSDSDAIASKLTAAAKIVASRF